MNNASRLQQVANMITQFKNPKQAVLSMKGKINNPMISNLIQYAENGDTQKIENFGRNFFKSQNVDLDEEMNNLYTIMNAFKK